MNTFAVGMEIWFLVIFPFINDFYEEILCKVLAIVFQIEEGTS